MFESDAHLLQYIKENYPEVTDHRIDEDHWDLTCTRCKVVRGFQVVKRDIAVQQSQRYGERGDQDYSAPITYLFRCPVCEAFKMWLVFERVVPHPEDRQNPVRKYYFRVTSLPSEGLEDIQELPSDPPALRVAYRQAARAMDANAHLAAAAMFRRALQVITRDLLGTRRGNLARELEDAIGKSYKGVTITANFASVGYIVKEAGNQGAHPDADPNLLDFTSQDAEDLQRIFMELVSELFIVPEAARKAKEDFLTRRKISTPPVGRADTRITRGFDNA